MFERIFHSLILTHGLALLCLHRRGTRVADSAGAQGINLFCRVRGRLQCCSFTAPAASEACENPASSTVHGQHSSTHPDKHSKIRPNTAARFLGPLASSADNSTRLCIQIACCTDHANRDSTPTKGEGRPNAKILAHFYFLNHVGQQAAGNGYWYRPRHHVQVWQN